MMTIQRPTEGAPASRRHLFDLIIWTIALALVITMIASAGCGGSRAPSGGAGGGTGVNGGSGGSPGAGACGAPGQPRCAGNQCAGNGCCAPQATDGGNSARLCIAAGQACSVAGLDGLCSAGSCTTSGGSPCGAVGQHRRRRLHAGVQLQPGPNGVGRRRRDGRRGREVAATSDTRQGTHDLVAAFRAEPGRRSAWLGHTAGRRDSDNPSRSCTEHTGPSPDRR